MRPASLRAHPILAALGAAVALALAAELALALVTAPNNWDALTYHLSRAAAWYQRGSIGFFPAYTLRENVFPPNAELQVLWTMVFVHGDRLAAMPQLTAEVVLLGGVFGVARRLGFARGEAAFAALLFATLSEVVLEATTVQNDLVVTAFVVAAAYFVLGRTRRELALAAAAVALGLGTKLTALYAVPVLALLAVLALPRRRAAELAVASAVAFVPLGSLVYVENALRYGTPLGPTSVRAVDTPVVTAGGTVSTAARIVYRFADLSGYHADIRVRATMLQAGTFAFDKLGIDAMPAGATLTPFFFIPNIRENEDVSYFGPLERS